MTPIDETSEKIGVCHETAFNMRHKLLAYMESMTESLALLDELVEADETYVLESQKASNVWIESPESMAKGLRSVVCLTNYTVSVLPQIETIIWLQPV